MLAFAALIAVNAMWAFQFAGARIATRELGAVLVTLVPLLVATLLVLPFAGLNRDLFRAENRRILIIDDNPSIHEDFRKILGPGDTKLAAELDADDRTAAGR